MKLSLMNLYVINEPISNCLTFPNSDFPTILTKIEQCQKISYKISSRSDSWIENYAGRVKLINR
jgi:hypothetical protein